MRGGLVLERTEIRDKWTDRLRFEGNLPRNLWYVSGLLPLLLSRKLSGRNWGN